ncbi:MAG: peptide MFS transporter [Alphaproteobacteria bacterium]|nr:peptide MFS transporter [Alphaproteobacteria bacterium]
MSQAAAVDDTPTLLGHPTGLFTLFFAEMWERFSYYGMRALLVLYMLKGFLAYDDGRAYGIYGAYTALVYMTPFFGGMLADRVIGQRRAVVLGGVLMALGHLTMTIETNATFFTALALLIVGNGFFKPNISTIVGSLYDGTELNRAGGFTLFYMGINLGAAMAPLLCGYIGETYGWHYGFGLATVGMLVGIAVFVAPVRITQLMIGTTALASAIAMVVVTDGVILRLVNGFVALALVVAAVVALVALNRGGLPDDAGRMEVSGSRLTLVYVGSVLVVPLFALLVQNDELAGWLLIALGGPAILYVLFEALRAEKVEREKLLVVLILMFFSLLFWAFFEQAGSSINNFTDRNVDRVFEERVIGQDEVGATVALVPTQEQLGYAHDGAPYTLDKLNAAGEGPQDWAVDGSHVGMGVGGEVVPASVFQSANPIFILLFGPVLSWLWGALGRRKIEPSTPVKFALGLLQLGLGFGVLAYGVMLSDGRGMVGMSWLLLGYLLHTTGELCLSPVGLGMVTRLSPKRMVATVMGAWFLATAFSNYLASLIAKLTGVGGEGEEAGAIPVPLDTVHVYGDVFTQIAWAAIASAVLLFVLSPFLTRWMHGEK